MAMDARIFDGLSNDRGARKALPTDGYKEASNEQPEFVQVKPAALCLTFMEKKGQVRLTSELQIHVYCCFISTVKDRYEYAKPTSMQVEHPL